MVLNGEPGWVCLMCCNSDSEFILRAIPARKLMEHAQLISYDLEWQNSPLLGIGSILDNFKG